MVFGIGFGARAISGATGYVANAVDFDASAYLTKGTNLTGVTDSPLGSLSMWFRIDTSDGATKRFLGNDAHFLVERNSGNKILFTLIIQNGAVQYTFASASNYTVSATWHLLQASWNTTTGGAMISNLWIDNANDIGATSGGGTGFSVGYTANNTNWAVASDPGGTSVFDGCLAETWFAPGQYIDFSVLANRNKFRNSSSGKPISLGATGNTPTGTAPAIYLPNVAASVQTNAGMGGNFSVTGTPTVASTSPSS